MKLRFSAAAYDVEDVQKALYRFSDRLSGIICPEEVQGVIEIELTSLPSFKGDLSKLILDFQNEVNDQSLRRKIKIETEPLRNLILAHTFSKVLKN